jgi:hypothetical protein
MAEPVVIDYETFCKIHDCHDRQRLTSVLDPFKPRITRLLDTHPYSAQILHEKVSVRKHRRVGIEYEWSARKTFADRL